MATWTNWAGQQRCEPAVVARPRHESELAESITQAVAAGHTIRAIGSVFPMYPLTLDGLGEAVGHLVKGKRRR